MVITPMEMDAVVIVKLKLGTLVLEDHQTQKILAQKLFPKLLNSLLQVNPIFGVKLF